MSEISPLNPQTLRGLQDKVYEKRKAAALEVEKLVRDWAQGGDYERIRQVTHCLTHDYAYSLLSNARNGGVIGLAAVAIGLSTDVGRCLDDLVPPVLACFADQDPHVRFCACESMYNIANVAKAGILRFFNEVFDALSKLAADTDKQVLKGAGHLGMLIKDIVAEHTSVNMPAVDEEEWSADAAEQSSAHAPQPFTLTAFIPLLAERIHTSNEHTRMFLVQWLAVLNSVPDLELVVYLPEFLDGLVRFLSDPSQELRVATASLLADFLQEIRDIAILRSDQQVAEQQAQGSNAEATAGTTAPTYGDAAGRNAERDDATQTGAWTPGQGIDIDYTRIIAILQPHLTSKDEEIQLTAIRWVNEFMHIAQTVVVPFTPELVKAILPSLSSQRADIRDIAHRANRNLFKLIQHTEVPQQKASAGVYNTPGDARTGDQQSQGGVQDNTASVDISIADGSMLAGDASVISAETSTVLSRLDASQDPFDYHATVSALTLQFIDEHETTRVESLEWLLMLQRKAPHKILATDDGMFPVLLKTLSDSSERVIRRDLQLLAQFSAYSDDTYFREFMVHLLRLFSSDRVMLENRGSLIIRQLCLSLNPERIYRAFAEILEKEEASTTSLLFADLEFASIMVQNLNIILITSPEAGELRKRLRRMEAKENQSLFVALYRSWCHNAVATFSLCLLAQAYEHAANMLQIFAELEISVNFLIQLDKLVQLLESPVFTYLRLQLLEPDRHPYLFKCLYGILMLLPQSSAFATLRNRLNSVGAFNGSSASNKRYVCVG
ncbi:vacuolar protein 14 C-terminal Fig4p binding-domain-containing protein [Thamnocephalis sphaerospora]|uniref:Vacuolar protein 14 C-terminal Fig4p binding-domain-containing protein n=1 Tax=Thamnocephalis sphaerospora TaxID=78915 RepID=A0A4P9XT45_9FUNG|nr:vacuolar protein 14 C-terminal Fig4p binding-domain-containing protein [Thamnocephalis sphaerospora]|eukprot:RKP09317.1 vacuolar protein 14 C-terminal Fig4p binding-domain-containing protein [Thamnocephalis sphaerospora]